MYALKSDDRTKPSGASPVQSKKTQCAYFKSGCALLLIRLPNTISDVALESHTKANRESSHLQVSENLLGKLCQEATVDNIVLQSIKLQWGIQ
jgi:hypothetical protein